MLVPLLLLTIAPTTTTKTLHLKHVAPSQLTLQLIDQAARHPFTEKLERLTPNDTRNTLTLVGPNEAVKTVEQAVRWLDVKKPTIELEVEVVGAPDRQLKGSVLIAQNERGMLTLLARDTRLQFQLTPHINGDGTCSLMIATEQNQSYSVSSEGFPRTSRSGMSSFVRVRLGKPVSLGMPIGMRMEETTTSLPIRITPRLKK
jgi:type II secretory pathway component GspD/PulD (secretin)